MLVYGQDLDGNSAYFGTMDPLPGVGDYVDVSGKGLYFPDEAKRLEDRMYRVMARVFEHRAFMDHVDGPAVSYRWVCVLKLGRAICV